MNGTTFPHQPGVTDHQGDRGGYNSSGFNRENNQGGYQGNQGGYEKKPWNKDGFQKKPFQQRQEVLDPTIYIPYAITAGKETPPDVIEKLCRMARDFSVKGLTVRIGADGPVENAIDDAVVIKKELILPWKDFNNKNSKFTFTNERAMVIAKQFHPTFDNMKKGIQLILAKNARLILGNKMDSPARFFLTWTEDGIDNIKHKTAKTGFTGHPIAIASAAGVPIFNLGNPEAERKLNEYLDTIYLAERKYSE